MGNKKGCITWNKGKDDRIIVKCNYCGKAVKIHKCRLKYSKRFYCNVECRHKDWVGKNNPMCGKHQSELSKSIRSEMSKKNKGKFNPMFNKKIDSSGCNFYIDDLGHRCRSSWEINIGRILKYLHINYEYEKETFNLNKGDSYTPDFYLSELDLYLEVKGYETEKFKAKFIRFKKEYPKINILLINQEIYKLLKPIYENKINWEYEGKIKANFTFKDVKIKQIKKTMYKPKRVFNLSVDEDNSFVVNGLVVHNTAPHWTSVENLKKWAKDKLGDENLAYALQKSIAVKGTKPHPFIKETLIQEFPRLLAKGLSHKGVVCALIDGTKYETRKLE